MLFLRQFLVILALLHIAMGCSRLTNDNVDLQLECGVEANHDGAFVKVELPQSEAFQAVWLDHGEPRAASVSSKNCIEIPSDISLDSQLLIRSSGSLNGRILHLTDELRETQLTRVDFEANELLRSEFFQLSCVADATAVSDVLPLKRSSQLSSRLVYNLDRFQLSDREGQVVWKGNVAADAGILNFPVDLAEGRYRLLLTARDAFNMDDPPRESQCEVLIDRSAPSVKMIGSDFLVSPGQRIDFEVKDAQNVTLFGCMRERKGEGPTDACAEAEFKPIGFLSAPEKGTWDIYFFAEDVLGHRSPVNLTTLAVFHSDQIKQVNSLIQLSMAQETLWKQFASFTALQDAADIIKGFWLKAEQAAIKWDFLKGLADLNGRLSVRYQQVYPSWDKAAGENIEKAVSEPGSNVWVMLTNKGRAAVFIDKAQISAFESAKNAAFGPDGSLYFLADQHIRRCLRPQADQNLACEILLYVDPGFDQLKISESGRLLVAAGNKSILVYKTLEKSSKVYTLPVDSIWDILETSNVLTTHFSSDEKDIYYNLNLRIFGIDLVKEEQRELFSQPLYCQIKRMELRGDRLYVANKFIPALFQETQPPACGFNILPILSDGTLGALQHPSYAGSSQDVESLTLDATRNILVMAQNDPVSKNVQFFAADLRHEPLQFTSLGLQNYDQDVFLSFEILSFKNKKILIHTKNALATLEYMDHGPIALRILKLPSSLTCRGHAGKEMILCGDAQSRAVNFHDSDEDKRLQPRLMAGLANDFFAVSSRTGMKFSNDNVKANIGLYGADGLPLWTLPQVGQSKVGDLSPMGRYAVMATAEKTFYLYDRRGIVAQKTLSLTKNIDAVSVTDSGKIFMLVSQGNDKELLTYQLDGHELVGQPTAVWSNDSKPNRILVNPTNEFAIVYTEVRQSWRPVRQNVAIIDSKGSLKKLIDADNTRISFNADDRSWFRILGHEVWRYELENDKVTKIADNLAYTPNEVLDGEVPIAKAGEATYSLVTGKNLLPDGVVGLIEGNLLVWSSSSSGMLRVYSADGAKVLLEQESQPDEQLIPVFIYSDAKSPTFHVWRNNQKTFLTYLDSYTLDLQLALQWISLWNPKN